MKALVMREPGSTSIEEVAEPEMKQGEALLRVRRIGLCGSDLNSFRGKNPLVSFPRILGHEVAATIVALSQEHPHLLIGMDVTLSPYTSCNRCAACRNGRNNACQWNETLGVQRDGALAEYISMPMEKLYPANLSLQELCLVEPLTVGFHAVARGQVTKGDTVAVLGCGGVGLGAIAAARFKNATVIAIDLEDAKLAIAHEAGASHTIHSKRQDLSAALAELTDGVGPSVVVEAIGTPATFLAAVEEVAYTGRVVYIGYAKEPVMYDTKLFVRKEIDIRGARNAVSEDFRDVIQMLQRHQFPVESTVNTIVSLAEAPQVLSDWSANPGKFTKIMINLDHV